MQSNKQGIGIRTAKLPVMIGIAHWLDRTSLYECKVLSLMHFTENCLKTFITALVSVPGKWSSLSFPLTLKSQDLWVHSAQIWIVLILIIVYKQATAYKSIRPMMSLTCLLVEHKLWVSTQKVFLFFLSALLKAWVWLLKKCFFVFFLHIWE